MATADELLARMTNSAEDDGVLVIDNDLRTINVPKSITALGVEYDDDVHRLNFQMPRMYKGVDLSTFNIRINYMNAKDEGDIYVVTDKKTQSSAITFSWLVGPHAFAYKGTVKFIVCLKETDPSGKILREFNTTIATLPVLEGLEVDTTPLESELSDILEQLQSLTEVKVDEIEAEGDAQIARVQEEGAKQKEAVALKGEETLKTIPEDYTTTYQMAEEVLRRKANAIELESNGETIFVDNSSDAYLLGLKLYGNTTQVKTTGKQLLRVTKTSGDLNGAKIFVHDDGSFTLSGTVTANKAIAIGKFMSEGELIMSLDVTGDRNASYMYIAMEPADNIGWYGEDKKFTGDGTERTLYAVIISGTYYDTTFYPMIRSASVTDGTYEPYSGGYASPCPDWPQEMVSIENPTASIFGKNLLNADLLVGGTFVKNDDGTYTFTKLANSATSATCPLNLPAGDYVMSWSEAERTCESYRVYINYADGSTQLTGLTNLGTNKLVLSTEVGIKDIRLSLASNVTTDTYVKFAWLQIEAGTEATEYEPYKDVQTITLNRTLRSLTALYWDGSANAGVKEVVRDWVDLERGVLVQRIGVNTMDSKDIYTSYMLSGKTGRGQLVVSPSPAKDQAYNATLCSVATRNGVAMEAVDSEYYENPANIVFVGAVGDDEATMRAKYADFELLYVLETPIEIPLTDEELTYFKRLKTNYHNTTVMNDSGAHMGIKYAADTKMFFETHSIATDSQVQSAVNAYLKANPVTAGSTAAIGMVELLTSKWTTRATNLHAQVVNIAGVTENSQVDLTPSVEQLVVFYEKDLTFVTENDGGTVTVYAIGQKPTNDYTIQVTITEVNV